MKYITSAITVFVIAIALGVAVPAAHAQSGASSLSELQSRIQSLMGQFNLLQDRIKNVPAVPTTVKDRLSDSVKKPFCSYPFSRPLGRGARGIEVSNLQDALKSKGFFSGDSTGYFGTQTEDAIKQFQAKNGIVASGDRYSTGFGLFGQKTQTALLVDCVTPYTVDDKKDTDDDDDKSPAFVDGVLKVEPKRGEAPLKVTFTIDDDAVGGFKLDYGDRSAKKNVQAGDVRTHTYKKPGRYIAQLTQKSGSSRVSLIDGQRRIPTVEIVVTAEDEDEDEGDEYSLSDVDSITVDYKMSYIDGPIKYRITLDSGRVINVSVPSGMSPVPVDTEKPFHDTGYTGDVDELIDMADDITNKTETDKTDNVKSYSLSDVGVITVDYKMSYVDGPTKYTVILLNRTMHTVLVQSGLSPYPVDTEKPFRESGYTGDVGTLIAKAINVTSSGSTSYQNSDSTKPATATNPWVRGASTTNFSLQLEAMNQALLELKASLTQ